MKVIEVHVAFSGGKIMNRIRPGLAALILAGLLTQGVDAFAQLDQEKQHKRGKLWENLSSDGFIGSYGAWDYLTPHPLGMYPGFNGYVHPIGREENAWGVFVNANFHNFRSGSWIAARNLLTPGAPPTYTPLMTDYENYYSGLQKGGSFGTENTLPPLVLKENYIERPGFNPLLPEEMIEATWHTNTGITVTRRSYVWSFPGYSDFIIYDYIFKNTGSMVSTQTGIVVPGFPQQTLNGLYFGFHSGISVSTKSQINFHAESGWKAVSAGGFGWEIPSYHDYYHVYDNGELVFSTNYNGGREPLYFWEAQATQGGYDTKDPSEWKSRFGEELQSPAAFGWVALYADPLTGQPPRTTPRADVLRIDSHKGGVFQGLELNLEGFPASKKQLYDFSTVADTQATLANGTRMNFYTFSYGPYQLAPGDSVRFILAEVAGVMDYAEAIAGDPNGYFPDSTIAAIRRNADAARNAIRWGIGAPSVNGIPVIADVPEPPPGPNVKAINQSVGVDTAIIAVIWDKVAETTVIQDGAGAVFYDGATDLGGYRIYRSTDFQYVSDEAPKVLRGATWNLLKDIPRDSLAQYAYEEDGVQKYRFLDRAVVFDDPYGYYVSSYYTNPRAWTSANGTVENNLPPLESGDYNRTGSARAFSGPNYKLDIFVAPNPYVYNHPNRSFPNDPFQIVFRNLPDACVIRIYTIAGDLVRVLRHSPDDLGNLSGSETWDQKSDSGLLVAPGLYIYHVESKSTEVSGMFIGKLMIIR